MILIDVRSYVDTYIHYHRSRAANLIDEATSVFMDRYNYAM